MQEKRYSFPGLLWRFLKKAYVKAPESGLLNHEPLWGCNVYAEGQVTIERSLKRGVVHVCVFSVCVPVCQSAHSRPSDQLLKAYLKQHVWKLMWRYLTVIPTRGRWRQEDRDFRVIPGRPYSQFKDSLGFCETLSSKQSKRPLRTGPKWMVARQRFRW